jgi:hypothetical protein
MPCSAACVGQWACFARLLPQRAGRLSDADRGYRLGAADTRYLRQMSARQPNTSTWTPSCRIAHDGCVKAIYPGDGDSDPADVPGVCPEIESGADVTSSTGDVDSELWLTRAVDETSWQIGGSGEVAWIMANTRPGRTIATAIPPVFGAYATVIVPGKDEDKQVSDAALLGLLRAQGPHQPWWLGYLETGATDLVFPDAPRARLYWEWPYVLVKAGPDQAASWRTNEDATPWHGALPELVFPLDRSWLVSTLWDDDWRCVGGPTSLVEAILRHPRLDARAVALEEDATPPGHRDG